MSAAKAYKLSQAWQIRWELFQTFRMTRMTTKPPLHWCWPTAKLRLTNVLSSWHSEMSRAAELQSQKPVFNCCCVYFGHKRRFTGVKVKPFIWGQCSGETDDWWEEMMAKYQWAKSRQDVCCCHHPRWWCKHFSSPLSLSLSLWPIN